MDDSTRSVKRNIEEGWKRPTTKEYLDFLGYSQASLEEVKGDIRDCHTDGYLTSRPGSSLKDVGIDLGIYKGPLRVSKGGFKDNFWGKPVYGEPTEPGHPYYKSLTTLKGNDLTFEMFMEIINKTDWLFRQRVDSLEERMAEEVPMSSRERWLKAQREKRLDEERKFDEEILKKEELVFTKEGVMKKEEAERKGLKEIERP